MGELKQKVVKGSFWAFVERFGTQGERFITSLVLARLLTPNDYGTIALLTIFLSVASVLADSGFGKALVQKKDATEADFNSVFYLSIAVSSALYGILFFCAPLIAAFYKVPELVGILRVFALTLIFSAINGVQDAELIRRMRFDLSFKISLVTCAVSGISGIMFAYAGFGPWSLVWCSVCSMTVGTILRWTLIAWRPKLMFSWQSVKSLFCYGWKLSVSSLLETLYNQISGLIIGKFYSKAELAFVNRGQSVAMLPMEAINGTIGRVAFPALAQLQNDRPKVREAMRKVVQCSTFLVFPLMAGCGVCADEIIRILYGSQWQQCVPFVRLACFSFALWPMHTVNLNAISAVGRSDIYLKLEIIKKCIGVVGLIIAIPYGAWWMMAVSALVVGPLGLVVNVWPNRRLLGYTLGMMLVDVFPCVMSSCIMMGAVVGLKMGIRRLLGGSATFVGSVSVLAFEVIVGVFVYFIASYCLKISALFEYLKIVKAMKGGGK